MKLVYRAANLVEAQLVADVLVAEGIGTTVTGGYLSGAIGELPPSDVIGVRVHDDREEPRARALIREYEIERRTARADWFCRGCGERIDGAFGACWRCGAPAPS